MSPAVLPLATQFVKERQYLHNVTPATLEWYASSFKAFSGCETENQYLDRVMELRQRGLSPVSINTWLRCINAYLKWAKATFRLPKLKAESKLITTLSKEQISRLVAYKGKSLNDRRIHVLACLLLDTGIRIAEACGIKKEVVDLDQCQIKVMGKGRKERVVPISPECRKILFRWMQEMEGMWLFGTGTGSALSVRNAQRDLAELCEKVGIKGVRRSPHTFRHSFSVSYLKAGGNLEFLRRILGHSSIQITQRYLQSLTPEDLGRVHNSLSPLAQL